MQLLSDTIGNAVIRRINTPRVLAGKMTRGQSLRARSRVMLSFHDEQDAKQTVALALVSAGLPDATKLAVATTECIASLCPMFRRSTSERESYLSAARTVGLSRWKACFRSVRKTLRIDRRVREDATDFATRPELDIAAEHPEVSEARRARLARFAWYAHSMLHAARGADTSRKAASTFRTHLATLRAYTAILAGRLIDHPLCDGTSEDAIHVRLCRYRAYLAKGEAALTAATLSDTPLFRAPRTFHTFSALPVTLAQESALVGV